jgi:hypothetical protein
MLAKKSSNDTTAQPAIAAESRFTPDEMARLATLRERYQTQPDCGEYGLDPKRLAFARYLVRKGILSEDL